MEEHAIGLSRIDRYSNPIKLQNFLLNSNLVMSNQIFLVMKWMIYNFILPSDWWSCVINDYSKYFPTIFYESLFLFLIIYFVLRSMMIQEIVYKYYQVKLLNLHPQILIKITLLFFHLYLKSVIIPIESHSHFVKIQILMNLFLFSDFHKNFLLFYFSMKPF